MNPIKFVSTSSLRHSFTTRLLVTVVPSEIYVGDRTLDDLHEALAKDVLAMYHDGLEAPRLSSCNG